MKRTNLRAAAVAVVLGAVALAFGTSGPSAAPVVTSKTTVSSQTVLDWNVIAVNTVRGATPAKFQIEGQLYMTYVQAAVYDAVAAIKGKEDGKGKDTSFRKLKLSIPGASSRAAAASAAYSTLVYFFPAQAATLTSKYTDYLNVTLSSIPADVQAGRRRGRSGRGGRSDRFSLGRRPRRADRDPLRRRARSLREPGSSRPRRRRSRPRRRGSRS